MTTCLFGFNYFQEKVKLQNDNKINLHNDDKINLYNDVKKMISVNKKNVIKEAILNNDPIEEKLHVIIVISNPCLYRKRYVLMKEFIERIERDEQNVLLYIVELAYKGQDFFITQSNNENHLQLQTDTPLWHKENMINLGVQKLLPQNLKAFAWIDCDIEFESPTWVKDTLKILNGSKDIVQLFSHAIDMNRNKDTMSVFSSFGYQYCKEKSYETKTKDSWHPGYAWACTRKAYEKIGGLFEYGIIGGSDNTLALSLINNGLHLHKQSNENLKKCLLNFQKNVKTLRLGYVPGVIRHYFHGSKVNRKYMERKQILLKYNYDPLTMITHDINGVIIPTDKCPKGLIEEIMSYFNERNEDE